MTDRFVEGQLVQIVSPVEPVFDDDGVTVITTMSSNQVLVYKRQPKQPDEDFFSYTIEWTLGVGQIVLYLGPSDLAGRAKILIGDRVCEVEPEFLKEVSKRENRNTSKSNGRKIS